MENNITPTANAIPLAGTLTFAEEATAARGLGYAHALLGYNYNAEQAKEQVAILNGRFAEELPGHLHALYLLGRQDAAEFRNATSTHAA